MNRAAANSASLIAVAAATALIVTATPFAASPAVARDAEPQATSADYGAGRLGPKKSVAVIDFGANGRFLANYGGWNAGGGLAAMMETQLAETHRVRLVNRSHLDAALYEQQLSASGLTAANTAPAGELIGAQYLVRATVTDFTLAEKGGGISIGGTVGGVLGGISPQSRTGRVSIDFEVVDSTSGEIVDSFSVTRKVRSRSIALSASKSGLNVGANSFENTPLGDAAREAIDEASHRIVQSLQGQSWAAHVAQVRPNALYVNVGADANLQPGDSLRIFRVVDEIRDPITGALLGREKAEIGHATISSVSEKYSKASFSAAVTPEAGDILVFENQQFAQLGGE